MLRMCTLSSVAVLCAAAVGAAYAADSRLQFKGDFETGLIQPKRETHDGFFVKTLPHPQGSTTEVSIARGGGGPDSGLDTRVVRSDRVGSETVQPRRGDYFVRSAVYRDKDYSRFKGNSGKNKPRSNIGMNGHDFDYDTEGYVGFSIYVPKNFENEVGKKGEQGKSMLLTIGAPSAETFFNLNVWVPTNDSEAHWFIRTNLNDQSVTEMHKGTVTQDIDLGKVAADKGKWTDFVVRFRSNPFSRDTNPAQKGINGAMNRMFEGNKGILQVWKAEGGEDSKGNRRMSLVLNKVNEPVGLVPHNSWQLDSSFRIYKHGWHLQPSSVKGPVWFGFDEIRFGLTGRDGTTYADVHPANLSCTDGCKGIPNSNYSPPLAPTEVTVSQAQ